MFENAVRRSSASHPEAERREPVCPVARDTAVEVTINQHVSSDQRVAEQLSWGWDLQW